MEWRTLWLHGEQEARGMSDRLVKLKTFYEADPSDTFCTYGLAMECDKLGRAEEALGWLEKTIELDGDYAYAFYQQARILGGLSREAEALVVIERGIAAAQRHGDDHADEELRTLRDSLV